MRCLRMRDLMIQILLQGEVGQGAGWKGKANSESALVSG